MREELMKDALCWEIGAKVTAEYAYSEKDLSFFAQMKNVWSRCTQSSEKISISRLEINTKVVARMRHDAASRL